MIFAELPVGAKFRFLRRGLLLTHASKNNYTALAGRAQKAAPDAEVLPEEEDATAPRATPKPDDVTLLPRALDEFEAKSGKTPELATARQALRRLEALARPKSAN